MNIVAVTMVYNEGERLIRWIDYYGRQLGREALLVIDHGSDDGSTSELNVATIKLPRSQFDDIQRADFISDLSKAMLSYYDAMIYTDCDELLVADPEYHDNLRSFLMSTQGDCIRPVGFDLVQMRSHEDRLRVEDKILQQRQFCVFRSTSCKPCITKAAIRWCPGFHHSSALATVDTTLFLFHTKHIDYEYAKERQRLTRELQWSDRSIEGKMGAHQRLSDEDMTKVQFDSPQNALVRMGAREFSRTAFDQEVETLRNGLQRIHNIYRCAPYSGSVYKIPERLKNAF